jgi:bifunctional DNA-binding transcriptional regulator/antitoxin component of YhaV-PrlF toxin-antitoxin module
MNKIPEQLGDVVKLELGTDQPKIPTAVTRSLRLAPHDILVIKETEKSILLVPLERSMPSTAAKSKHEIARLKVGRDGRSRIPLEVLEAIGGKIGGSLKFIRGVGNFKIEAEFNEWDAAWAPLIKEEIAQKKRQANIKHITKCLIEAQARLTEATELIEKLPEGENENLRSAVLKAIQQIRIANYFSA